MISDGKGTFSKYSAPASVILAVASGVLQVSGVSGNLVFAAALLALSLFSFWIYSLFIRVRPGRPTRMSLERVLAKYGKNCSQIDCVFSAGDQLRQFLDARAHEPQNISLSVGTKVRLVTRQRTDGEELHVSNNMQRLGERIRAQGSSFDSRSVIWDNFMVGGILFDDNCAAVRFYHRVGGRTAAVGDGFLVVHRQRGGYESELFAAIRVAFDCLWASAHGVPPAQP